MPPIRPHPAHHRLVRLLRCLPLLLAALAAPALAATQDGQVLPVAQAFQVRAERVAPGRVHLHWTIAEHYYLYRGRIHVSTPGKVVRLGALQLPDGLKEHDPYLGDIEIYHHAIDATLAYSVLDHGASTFQLAVRVQGCHEVDPKICYPPHTTTLTVPLHDGAASAAAAASGLRLGGGRGDGGQAPATTAQSASPPAPAAASVTLWLALLLALGGGLLLNLMPCVLPVLSLKVVSLVEGREGPRVARHRALAYTAGVLLSFTAAGLLVVGLRAVGMASGWGFQLQQPVFVAILAYVVLAMGLSYSGVVHFGAGLAGTGQSLTARSGLAGDFFTGVLAVVLASPCTAPAMGTALAFAFAAPWYDALLVFVVLGLGLALPFLLIGWFPVLGRWLPRPGAWMETLKQVLAFPLYLTAAWLAWVLTQQRGADAVGLLLAGAVLLALALWWLERSRYRGLPSKGLAGVLLLVALLPLGLIHTLPAKTPPSSFTQKLAQLREQGRPVFVDISAAWCITCKANEHAVLDTNAFHALLRRTGTVYLKGDWTDGNPDITAFLHRWHSPGVPVYVVFPAGGGRGQKLPTLLTAGRVRRALEAAATAHSG